MCVAAPQVVSRTAAAVGSGSCWLPYPSATSSRPQLLCDLGWCSQIRSLQAQFLRPSWKLVILPLSFCGFFAWNWESAWSILRCSVFQSIAWKSHEAELAGPHPNNPCLSVDLKLMDPESFWVPGTWISFILFFLLWPCQRCFPSGSDGEESACSAEDPGLIPELGRSPGEGNGNPLQYSCLENPMDGGAWWATAMGSQRVGDNWATNTFFVCPYHLACGISVPWPRIKPTPIPTTWEHRVLTTGPPGKSQQPAF